MAAVSSTPEEGNESGDSLQDEVMVAVSSTPEEGKESGDSLQEEVMVAVSSTPEEGKESGDSLQEEAMAVSSTAPEEGKEEGSSGDDTISDSEFWDKIICESESESSEKPNSDFVTYDSDVDSDEFALRDPKGYPIYSAILRDDADALLKNLPCTADGKPDCDIPFGMYISPLHRACMSNKINCAKALIRGGCNILAGLGSGVGVPFHLACAGDFLPLIKFMIDDARIKGDNILHKMIHATNFEGLTPLDLSQYDYEIMKLIDPSADPSSSNEAPAGPPSKKQRTE